MKKEQADIEVVREIIDTTFADDGMTDRSESRRVLYSALSALEVIRDAKYGKSPALKFVELKLQIAKLLKENKELREANNNLQEGLDRYIKVFSHHHQAGQPNQDTCLSCGLDIRENIHIKE